MKLSVITINLNNKTGLLRTLASVESQIDRQFEHVIVDGASTDGSVEVIKEYAERHDNVRWISEPDTGIYNAMNKAARMATADYILYINSGDELFSTEIVNKFRRLTCDSEIILGKTLLVDSNNGSQKKIHYKLCEPSLSFLVMLIQGIAHQSAFIKRITQVNTPYDESLNIVADFHFFMKKIIFENCSISLADFYVSKFYTGGVSYTDSSRAERESVIRNLMPERIMLDYKGLNIEGVQMLKKLSKYDGFKKWVLWLDNLMIYGYTGIKKIISVLSFNYRNILL